MQSLLVSPCDFGTNPQLSSVRVAVRNSSGGGSLEAGRYAIRESNPFGLEYAPDHLARPDLRFHADSGWPRIGRSVTSCAVRAYQKGCHDGGNGSAIVPPVACPILQDHVACPKHGLGIVVQLQHHFA